MRWIVLLLMTLQYAIGAGAQANESLGDSGNAFVRICGDTTKSNGADGVDQLLDKLSCSTYVTGVRDGLSTYTGFITMEPDLKLRLLVCIPKEVTTAQVTSITLQYIRRHPDTADLPTASLIYGAMLASYPCSAKNPPLP